MQDMQLFKVAYLEGPDFTSHIIDILLHYERQGLIEMISLTVFNLKIFKSFYCGKLLCFDKSLRPMNVA